MGEWQAYDHKRCDIKALRLNHLVIRRVDVPELVQRTR